MNISVSPFAFQDAEELFERALATERGIKITFETRGAAIALRHRMNKHRVNDRRANVKTYPEDNPLHGTSTYDRLRLRIPNKGSPDETTLFIEPRTAEAYRVEEI